MAVTKSATGGDGLAVEGVYDDTGVCVQTSADIEAVVAGMVVDTRLWTSLVFTIVNASAVNTAQWAIYGSYDSAFATEVTVQALTDVLPTAIAGYAVTQSIYPYYRVTIHSKVNGAHAACTVRGVQKP